MSSSNPNIVSSITKTSFKVYYLNKKSTMSIRVRVRKLNNEFVHDKTYYTSSGNALARTIYGLTAGEQYKLRIEQRISSSFHTLLTSEIRVTTFADPIPASIQIQNITSSAIACLVKGDPSATFRMEVAGQIVENIKSGDIVDIDKLESDTSYTLNLY